MDRLTVREWSGGYVPETNSFDVWDRLAAYEDTDMMPDEVVTLKAEKAHLRAELGAAKRDMVEISSREAPCYVCKHDGSNIPNSPCKDCGDTNHHFEWRGLCADNAPEGAEEGGEG